MTDTTERSAPDGAQTTNGAAAGADGVDAPAAAGSTPGGRSAEVRELERQLDDLREKVKTAETRAQENLDRWQRAQADLANYRRRAQFEREEMEKYAVASLVAALLPVLDNFERAWQTLPTSLRRMTWLSGVDMVNRQLAMTLERIGLSEIEAHGKPFDPAHHEAVERADVDGTPHVVEVLQAGYTLHERVLRPALVRVGAKPAASGEAPGSGSETGDSHAGGAAQGGAAESANG